MITPTSAKKAFLNNSCKLIIVEILRDQLHAVSQIYDHLFPLYKDNCIV